MLILSSRVLELNTALSRRNAPVLLHERAAVHRALEQARRYADEQKVTCIAVSDGVMFYAANIEEGGLHRPHLRLFRIYGASPRLMVA